MARSRVSAAASLPLPLPLPIPAADRRQLALFCEDGAPVSAPVPAPVALLRGKIAALLGEVR